MSRTYYAATVIADTIAKSPRLDDMENRMRKFGAWELAKTLTNAPDSPVSAEARAAFEENTTQTDKIPVFTKVIPEAGSSRICSATANDGETAMVTPQWQTVSTSFTVLRHRQNNNLITTEEEMAQKLQAAVESLLTSLNSKVISAMDTNKNQVYNDSLDYTITSNVVAATADQSHQLFGDVIAMEQANDFDLEKVYCLGGAGMMSIFNDLRKHGAGNDQNDALELGNISYIFDRSVTAANKYAAAYFVPSGSFCVLVRFSPEEYAGDNVNNEEFGITTLPGVGRVGYHYKSDVGDHTSLKAGTGDCSIQDQYIFNMEIAIVHAYNSAIASNPSPIIKATIDKKTAGIPVMVVNTGSNPVETHENSASE